MPVTEFSRIDVERLEMDRTQVGEAWFRQEYLCEFQATDAQMVDSDLANTAVDEEGEWMLTAWLNAPFQPPPQSAGIEQLPLALG